MIKLCLRIFELFRIKEIVKKHNIIKKMIPSRCKR